MGGDPAPWLRDVPRGVFFQRVLWKVLHTCTHMTHERASAGGAAVRRHPMVMRHGAAHRQVQRQVPVPPPDQTRSQQSWAATPMLPAAHILYMAPATRPSTQVLWFTAPPNASPRAAAVFCSMRMRQPPCKRANTRVAAACSVCKHRERSARMSCARQYDLMLLCLRPPRSCTISNHD